jgi:hypothetical protein
MKKVEENNNEVIEDVEVKAVEEETEIVLDEKKGLFDKPKAFFQKHGKKVVVGALVALGTVAGYALGKQAGINSVDTYGEDCTSDETNDDYDSESNTSEF